MPVTLAFIHHFPLLRILVPLLAFMFLCLVFAGIGGAIYVRYRRHAEIRTRLKTLEDKLDRLASPPAPPPSK